MHMAIQKSKQKGFGSGLRLFRPALLSVSYYTCQIAARLTRYVVSPVA